MLSKDDQKFKELAEEDRDQGILAEGKELFKSDVQIVGKKSRTLNDKEILGDGVKKLTTQ